MHTRLRRLYTALCLTVELFTVPTILLGLSAIVYLLLQWRFGSAGETTSLKPILFLLISYSIVGVGAFIWKFIQAPRLLRVQDLRDAEVEKQFKLLTKDEITALRDVFIKGEVPVGSPVFDSIAQKTNFLNRDFEGKWRLNSTLKDPLQTLLLG